MKSLDRLIQWIEDDPTVRRFRELEAVIDADTALQGQYKELLKLQKVMVQQEAMGHPGFPNAKASYEQRKDELMDHVLLGEYLALLELLNDDLQLMQQIIEDELNKEFD